MKQIHGNRLIIMNGLFTYNGILKGKHIFSLTEVEWIKEPACDIKKFRLVLVGNFG